jgi:hypothetical protein
MTALFQGSDVLSVKNVMICVLYTRAAYQLIFVLKMLNFGHVNYTIELTCLEGALTKGHLGSYFPFYYS